MLEAVFSAVFFFMLFAIVLVGFLIFVFRDLVVYPFEVAVWGLAAAWSAIVSLSIEGMEIVEDWLWDIEILDDPAMRALFMGVADAILAGGYWANTDFYNTQYKIMRSATVGDFAVERLKLDDRPPFKDNPSAGALLMAHVTVQPIVESRLVLMEVTHKDPEEAALWANTVADVYIEQSLASRLETAKKTYQWLQERLTSTQEGMREAQERLLKSYQTQDLFVPEGSQSAISSSISRLTGDHIEARPGASPSRRPSSRSPRCASGARASTRSPRSPRTAWSRRSTASSRPSAWSSPASVPSSCRPTPRWRTSRPRSPRLRRPRKPGPARSSTVCGPSTGSSRSSRPS